MSTSFWLILKNALALLPLVVMIYAWAVITSPLPQQDLSRQDARQDSRQAPGLDRGAFLKVSRSCPPAAVSCSL